jgi:tetratricopeptide (TPR) repeat protein
LDKALDCFEKAEDYSMCGELCIRMGRKDYAAEWFLLAEERKRAAELFLEAGHPERAAELYLEAGLKLDAALAFSRAGRHTRAGEIYESSTNFVKAGDAFEKAEEFQRAAENFARQIVESGGAEGRYVGSREKAELTQLSRRAAQCYQRIGDLEKAKAILETGGQHELAAQIAEKLGQYRGAAELYQRAEQTQKAAEMYALAGDEKTAASLVGDQQLSAGDQEAAAESFIASGDAVRAAEIFEGMGRYDRAAECYAGEEAFAQAADASLRAGKKDDAAEYFEKAKVYDRAAELYAELGTFDRAAKLFAETDRFFEAAKAASETNSETLMVEYLQRVPSDDPNYLTAVLQLGRSFNQRGWSSLAVEKLNSALQGQAVRSENLDLWCELAQAYEAEGDLKKASELFHRIMAVQYDYRDIRERHARILESMEDQKRRETTLRASPGSRAADRYVLETLLGKGGMGSVYKAYDRLLKRPVAYKVLSGQLADNPKARDQLLNEARTAAALNHPNIITIFDVGLEGGQAFICMELIEGKSYAEILREEKWLEIPEAMHFLVSVCQGLDHAHQRGIVHRDLKPSNLLLTEDNHLKIVDFGLAQPIEDIKNAPPGTSLSGTPRYISPEQARGDVTDARSDVYSLGATLYNVLVGHAPFTEGNVIMHHLYTPPPPLRSERPEIPSELEELVLHCLAKHPAERYQTAGEVLSFASAARLL